MNKLEMQKTQTVPEGYKQTEVGETNSSGTNLDANSGPKGGGMDSRRIPEDWKVVLLDAVTSKVGSGKTPSGGSTVYVDSGRPFVRSQNIGWGNLKLDDLAFITDEVHNTFLSSEIQKNDVFLNITGASIGRSALTSHELVGGNVNQHVCIVRACSEKLSPRLLVYLLNSDLGQRQIDSYQAGGNREGLNFSQIKNMSFGIPLKIKEQTAIANALSDVDALISELEKLIAKKQAIKTATMQQLLTGKIRLPQFATHPDGTKKGYKQTELGQVPEDWEVKSIGNFTDCTAGGTPSTLIESYWGGNNPWMSSGELHQKKVFDVAERITDEGLKNSSTKYVPKESVLIGLAGQGKTRGTAAISKIELCTNQSIAAIFPSTKHDAEFLYYNLDSRYEELRGLSTGDGGRGGLNLSIIRKVKLSFPSIEEQTAIATILSDMDSELDQLKQRLAKTRQIKQGMMQELLTGKTRLV